MLDAPLLTARVDLALAELRAVCGDDVGARALRAEVRAVGETNGWTDLVNDAA